VLKEELRRSGSLVLRCADRARVPAGGALAVDRDVFAALVTDAIASHPRIRRHAEIVGAVPEASPENPVILATGPLTGDALAADLARIVGSDHLAYYDAIAPILSTDSIDFSRVFKQSRWSADDDAYVNCPFDEEGYRAFVRAL